MQLASLRQKLTVVPRKWEGDPNPPNPLHLYTETPDLFGMAREFVLGNKKPEHEYRLDVTGGDMALWPGPLTFSGSLRAEQEQGVATIVAAMREGGDLGGMLKASPGYGKTVCAAAIMARLQVPTLVVVHKEFLMNQWRDRLTQFLPGVRLGICQQDECDYIGKHVVIGMVHTLADRPFSERFLKWPGLLIVDEAHRIGAATWSVVPGKFPTRYRLGVTATPRRKDGAEKVFEYHLGRILFSAKEQRMVPKVRKVFTTFQMIRTPSLNPSTVKKPLLLKFLCGNPLRNALIANQIIMALAAGRKLLVLSERLAHLDHIEKALKISWPPANGAMPSIGYYVGGSSEKTRAVSATANVILATIQFAAEGLDIPALDTLILATPMTDIEQAVGRILRPHEGKKDPIVVDIRDDRVPMFKAFAAKRDHYYAKFA